MRVFLNLSVKRSYGDFFGESFVWGFAAEFWAGPFGGVLLSFFDYF